MKSNHLHFFLPLLCLCAPALTQAGGKVAAWGDNTYGQCLLPNGLHNIKAISAGTYYSLALQADGTVIGWGNNSYHQASPSAGLSNVTAIAAGYVHSVALLANGTVVTWGYNANGTTNVPVGLTGAGNRSGLGA
jgi:trimeric autotransporter adhesin